MSGPPYERLLRWYPPEWRARYGDEMAALLEDTFPDGRVTLRCRLGLVRAGSAERARAAGLVGPSADPHRRLRAGSALVLWGWCAVVIGGALFAKFTDNWVHATPPGGRTVASTAYGVVLVSAVLGCAAVLASAAGAAPAVSRLSGHARRLLLRRPVLRACAAGAVAAVLAGATTGWAHHLGARSRNGSLPTYSALVVATALALCVALVCATAAAVAVARSAPLGGQALRRFGLTALGLGVLAVCVLAGVVGWWTAEALQAPRVLSGGMGAGLPFTSAQVPPALLVAGFAIAVGATLAAWGAERVVGALRHRSP